MKNEAEPVAINLRPDLDKARLISVPLHLGGVPPGVLAAGYLKGRTLPVAAARFLETVNKQLSTRFA